MVISSKTEEQSLPITPAAPAPCTDRRSSPFPRKRQRARLGGTGWAGALHLSAGSHPPKLCRGSFSPTPATDSRHHRPPPGIAAYPVPGHRLGRGEGCSGGPVRRISGCRGGGLSLCRPPQHAPGLRSQPLHPASPPRTRAAAGASLLSACVRGAAGGGCRRVDPKWVGSGGSLPSGLPPIHVLTRMRGK